jgi:hypothetical protein
MYMDIYFIVIVQLGMLGPFYLHSNDNSTLTLKLTCSHVNLTCTRSTSIHSMLDNHLSRSTAVTDTLSSDRVQR